jgi:hypothetical protein
MNNQLCCEQCDGQVRTEDNRDQLCVIGVLSDVSSNWHLIRYRNLCCC